MNDTSKNLIDRAAAQFTKAKEKERNLALHEAEARAINEKTARLRALRLARDAAEAAARAPSAAVPKSASRRRKKPVSSDA